MKRVTRKPVALLLSFVMVASLFFGISTPAQAANVNYVKEGTYVYNWGERGETATFLSPMAVAFYQKNNTSYGELAALAGSSNTSSVSSSALYQELKDLMVSNHKKITNYQETRPMYQYTDCQNSGTDNDKISSFYSGKEIGPAWDSGVTWNREHTWPNSKGLNGDDENDIMMLRPTASSENSSRGNKAYGESSGYYNPNKESNGAYDVRGDVARIMLYQYVRWGNTSYMWGSSGVIESKEVLIKWMKLDPVDTWELGRNDAVEAITGTRNVFVDYPELAFELFDEPVPANYSSPSGAKQDAVAPKITGVENGKVYYTSQAVTATDENLASVTVNGKEVGGTFTLSGNVAQEYTIIAKDKTGNQTKVVVTMQTIASVADSIKSITVNNVKASDANAIQTVIKSATALLSEKNVTATEKAAIQKIIDNGNALLQKINNDKKPADSQTGNEDVQQPDSSVNDEGNKDTVDDSNTEVKDDVSTETENNADVENKDETTENQNTDNGGIKMEVIFVVMLIAGVAGLIALRISDSKEKKADK